MSITIDPKIHGFLATTEIHFTNHEDAPLLWQAVLDPLIQTINANDTLAQLRADPNIQATRQAYKQAGKDPSRYRPSSDSLWRRVINGKGLYHVNSLVDLNNALSLQCHLPLGSYDCQQLTAPLAYTIAPANATYPGIGKGDIDLSHSLALQDATGFFGSPTADSRRAMITPATTHALIVVYGFGDIDPEALQKTVAKAALTYLDDCKLVAQTVIRA